MRIWLKVTLKNLLSFSAIQESWSLMRNLTINSSSLILETFLWGKGSNLISNMIGFWRNRLWNRGFSLVQGKHRGSKKRKKLWIIRSLQTQELTLLNIINLEEWSAKVAVNKRIIKPYQDQITSNPSQTITHKELEIPVPQQQLTIIWDRGWIIIIIYQQLIYLEEPLLMKVWCLCPILLGSKTWQLMHQNRTLQVQMSPIMGIAYCLRTL